jgi:hypothetical protein
MCDAGIENPKKNVWLNKSIYPLNKTFLLGQKAKNTFFTQEAKSKKKCFHRQFVVSASGHGREAPFVGAMNN